VFRVLREEPALASDGPPAVTIFPGGRALGRVVEVARRDPADPGGASFPAGVAPATVSPVAGTISFPIDRLGRYEAFLEASTRTAVIFRETFDAVAPDGEGRAPLPLGWTGSELWRCGAPAAAAIAGGLRPAPASAPCLLALGLRRAPPGGAAPVPGTLTAAPFYVRNTGRTATLRALEWHDLGTDGAVDVALVLRDPGSGAVDRRPLATLAGRSAPGTALGPLELDITAALATGFQDLVVNDVEARLELRFTPATDATAVGLFLDDLEVRLAVGP
jgi:hypothetical protein